MKLPPSGFVPRLATDSPDTSSLDVMAALVADAVDGSTTIGELAEGCGVDEEMVQRIIVDLCEAGIVAAPGEGDAPAGDPDDAGQAAGAADAAEPSELAVAVEAVYQTLASANFYQLLGVDPDADRKELRSAYFALSKRFHPDRAFGDNVAELRRKMELVFRRITQAYDTVSNPKQRAEYDEYIADQLEMWAIEKQLRDALDERSDAGASEDGAAEPHAGDGKPVAQPRERQAGKPAQAGTGRPVSRMVRRTGGRKSPPRRFDSSRPVISRAPQRRPPVRKVSSNPPARSASSNPPARTVSSNPPARGPAAGPSSEELERRREMLKRERIGRALGLSLPQGSVASSESDRAKVDGLIDQASLAIEHDKHTDAMRLLGEALKLDKVNPRAKELQEQAEAGVKKVLAQKCLRQGRYEVRGGDLMTARGSFEKALEADPSNLEARHELAAILLEQRMDLGRAMGLAKQVIAMGGQRGRYFATLGELLLLAKQPERAAESFRRAIAAEPDNRDYKKRLKACKA